MRYYFHLEGGQNLHLDPTGQEFSELDDVLAHAALVACRFVEDKTVDDWSVVVVDSHNMEILRLPVADAVWSR